MALFHSNVQSPVMSTQTTLRPYQAIGAAWLREQKRAMLHDAPGIGKTLQAIAAAEPPVLVACPTYLVLQWQDVLAKERPNDSVEVAVGERAARLAAIDTHKDWTIINHAMLRSYEFPKRFYKTLILDEAHWFRGRSAIQSKNAARLAKNIPYVYLLSGTPIMREADDLWMQLHIIAPADFSSYWKFVETYMKTRTDMYGTRVVGVQYPELLKRTLKPYALRRTYKDVALELPPLISQDVPLSFDSSLLNVYRKVKTSYRKADLTALDSAVAVLTELRRLTVCKEKIEACKGIVEDARQGAVVFCWYRETADALGAALQWPVIHGGLDPAKRVATAKGARHVVATIASLSEGVDLSDKKMVVFFEVDYTPGSLEQALGRLQRWTDKANAAAPVRAYYLFMRNTIDESILKCVRRREHDVRRIVRHALAT